MEIFLPTPESFLPLLVFATVPVAIAIVAWRNRDARPIAAKLFLAAAICWSAPIGFNAVNELFDIGSLTELWDVSEPIEIDQAIVLEDELSPGSPGWRRMILWQAALSGFEIVAWSLMAWAILMRPDERHSPITACEILPP